MATPIKALLVTLEHDIPEEDAAEVSALILRLRGVQAVDLVPVGTSMDERVIERRVKDRLRAAVLPALT